MAALLLSAVAGGSSGGGTARLLIARLASALTASTSGSSWSSSSGGSAAARSLRLFAADAASSAASNDDATTPSPSSPPPASAPPPLPRSRLLRQRKAPVALTPAAIERVKALLEKRHKVRRKIVELASESSAFSDEVVFFPSRSQREPLCRRVFFCIRGTRAPSRSCRTRSGAGARNWGSDVERRERRRGWHMPFSPLETLARKKKKSSLARPSLKTSKTSLLLLPKKNRNTSAWASSAAAATASPTRSTTPMRPRGSTRS